MKKEVSIVLGCMNREKMLKISIHSWLYYDEIKEIIITDWSSHNSIKYLEKIDPRIKVIRVEGKEFYNASTPVNIAIKEAKYPIILKLDTDYVINPYANFHELIDIYENEFICGNWKKSHLDNNMGFVKGTNGFLCAFKKDIEKVGYYDETIENYGREDCQMFERLQEMGLSRKELKFVPENIPIYHNPHGDYYRSQNFKEKDITKTSSSLQIEYGSGKFDLIINLYRDSNPYRRREILSVLKQNIQNTHIQKIHVFLENSEDFTEYAELCQLYYDKLITHKINNRPSFYQLFNYCHQNINNKCIIANNDIIFTDDLKKAKGVQSHHMIMLTRHEHYGLKTLTRGDKTIDNIFATDCWIFKTPFIENMWEHFHIPEGVRIGTNFSDPAVTWRMKQTGFLSYNLSKDIKILHQHQTTIPASDQLVENEEQAIQAWKDYKRHILNMAENDNFLYGLNIVPASDFYHNKRPNQYVSWQEVFEE